jgi:hypothetical protein
VNYLEVIAEAVHEAAKGTNVIPEEERDLYLCHALLAVTVGEGVTRRMVHDAWSVWASLNDPDHPSLVPFDELPPSIQDEDDLFVAAIKSVAQSLRRDT